MLTTFHRNTKAFLDSQNRPHVATFHGTPTQVFFEMEVEMSPSVKVKYDLRCTNVAFLPLLVPMLRGEDPRPEPERMVQVLGMQMSASELGLSLEYPYECMGDFRLNAEGTEFVHLHIDKDDGLRTLYIHDKEGESEEDTTTYGGCGWIEEVAEFFAKEIENYWVMR